MAQIKAMVVFQGGSGLPEDRFINTFHFDNSAPYATHRVTVAARLADLYITGPAPAGPPLGSFLSPYVLRPFQIRCYDMATAPERVPNIWDFTLGAAPSSAVGHSVPEECAVVLSLRGAAPATPRRRGRIYLGPLNGSAVVAATGATPTRVSSTVWSTGASVLNRLATAPDTGWCIYSPTDDAYVPVVGGHIDNALDIQRRRGPDASARILWPTP